MEISQQEKYAQKVVDSYKALRGNIADSTIEDPNMNGLTKEPAFYWNKDDVSAAESVWRTFG
jgi:hypothetical protein